MSYRRIEIVWEDACSEDAWVDIEDVKEDVPLIVSVGWLISETKKAYVLALNYDDDNQKVSQTIVIPKSFVKEVWVFDNRSPVTPGTSL